MRNYNFSVVATAFHRGGVHKEFYSLKSALKYAHAYSSDDDEADRLRVFPNNEKGISIMKDTIKHNGFEYYLHLYVLPEILRDIKKVARLLSHQNFQYTNRVYAGGCIV